MEENNIKPNAQAKNKIGESGFTLIEVLIAIAIFAIGMLAIASMQLGATHGTTTARFSTELTAYATDQMERLTSLPYNDLELSEGSHEVDDPDESRFDASWEIVDDEIIEGTKTITLTASDTSRGNRTLVLQNVIPEIIMGDE